MRSAPFNNCMVLGPRLMESIGRVNDSFYQRECIIAVSLNHQQLYLSVALREKKVSSCPKHALQHGTVCLVPVVMSTAGADMDICQGGAEYKRIAREVQAKIFRPCPFL